MSYYIGIDVGTSSTKAVLIDVSGKIVFTVAPEYSFQTPKALWAECDPEDWLKATLQALKEIAKKVDPGEIRGIGLSGQMHGLVLLDEHGEVLRPCIMWNDQRTESQCEALTEGVGAERVLELTGNPILPGFTAPKILWVQENEPEIWARAARILLPKDYIRYRLSGSFFTEVSDASGTSLLNVGEREWSEIMLDACGIPRGMMAEVTESTETSTKLSEKAAQMAGLPAGLPIAGGGGDQAAGAIGCGIVKSGIVSATLGTSGVVFAHADTFNPDPGGRLHAFCAAVPGKWHYMGVQLSCAGSYQWFQKQLGGGKSYRDLDAMAEEIGAGAEGLIFLPYLSGERTPHPDPHARGVFFGLTLRHGLGHMARAVMEGVTFGLRDTLEIMRQLGISPEKIIVSGGGAQSPLWRQICADIFATEMVTVNAKEGAAFGAAILAAVGTGAYGSVPDACDAMLRETGSTKPGEETEKYDAYYSVFASLYPKIKDSFREVSGLVIR